MNPPKARPADTYGEHAVDFMRRMAELGVDAAIDAELKNPSWDDRRWCSMVVDLASRRANR